MSRALAAAALHGRSQSASASSEELSAQVAARLEEEIVLGRLHPRERMIEEELAGRFNVKRHIVRQALLELEHLGLVERMRNRGSVVRLYEAEEVEEINAVRELLEGHAAALIPMPLAPEAIAELRRIQQRHAEAVEDGDGRRVFRTNIDFHRALFAHCGNRALIEAITLFGQKSHAYRSIYANDTSYLRWAAEAHLAMIEAIETRDRERLVTLCREHLAPAKNFYIATWRSRFS